MKKTIIYLSILFIISCSPKTTPPALTLSQADADRAAAKYPGSTIATLTEGKTLYESHCGMCHGLKAAASHNEEQWNSIVPRMAKKVNKKMGTEEIDAAKEKLILSYLVTMSTAPKK